MTGNTTPVGRSWFAVPLLLQLIPLLFLFLGESSVTLSYARVGFALLLYIALDVLFALILGVGLIRQPRWRLNLLQCCGAVVAIMLVNLFAMLVLEVAGVAAQSLLVRLAVLLRSIALLVLLLHITYFPTGSRVGRGVQVGVVALITLVLVEIAVSIVFPFGYSVRSSWFNTGVTVSWQPYVGWAAPANAGAIAFSPGEFSVLMQTNSLGQRDHAATYARAPGVYRILALGDSYTWAEEVMLEDAWHVRLESLLSTVDRPVEIIAAGQPGWGTDQELQYLIHEGCRYQPDLVLLQIYVNDVGNSYMPFEQMLWGDVRKPYYELGEDGVLALQNVPYSHPRNEGFIFEAKSSLEIVSRTALLVFELLKGSRAPQEVLTTVWGLEHPETTLPYYMPDVESASREESYELMAALLAAFRQEAERCEAELAVFLIPLLHPPEYLHTMPPYYRDALPEWAGNAWHYREPEVRITALVEAAGIPIMPYERLVTFYDEYYAVNDNFAGLTWQWVGHFTPYAHEQLALMLAEWLETEGYLAPP